MLLVDATTGGSLRACVGPDHFVMIMKNGKMHRDLITAQPTGRQLAAE
jgi:hypothetical protein